VLASVRLLYTPSSFQSYYELMAFPHNLVSGESIFPWYNNFAFPSELRMSTP
jgi:hypothetical protein